MSKKSTSDEKAKAEQKALGEAMVALYTAKLAYIEELGRPENSRRALVVIAEDIAKVEAAARILNEDWDG